MFSRSVDRGDKSNVNTRAKPPLIVIIKRALCVLGKIHDGGPIWGFRDTGYLGKKLTGYGIFKKKFWDFELKSFHYLKKNEMHCLKQGH